MRKALVFGATGQAGHYMVKLLLAKGYDVYGTGTGRTSDIPLDVYKMFRVNLMHPGEEERVIHEVRPDEIYNLAGMLFAPDSWHAVDEYITVNGLAVVRMLEAVKAHCPKAKFFQAGSADVFDRQYERQHEETPRKASSPYGLAKIIAEEAVKMYREQRGLFACTGILFNMESPLRRDSFFAERVARDVVYAKNHLPVEMRFGSLSACRDWGLTEEYVEAMHLMLQAPVPDDYVIGTGESHSCLAFLQLALEEVGLGVSNPHVSVLIDNAKGKADVMQAVPIKIRKELGWQAKSRFTQVVKTLVAAELAEQAVPVG